MSALGLILGTPGLALGQTAGGGDNGSEGGYEWGMSTPQAVALD